MAGLASSLNAKSEELHRRRRRICDAMELPLPAPSDGVMAGVRIPHEVRSRLLAIQKSHDLRTFREVVYRAILVGVDALEEDAELVSELGRERVNGHKVLTEDEIGHLRRSGFGAPMNGRGDRSATIAILPFGKGPKPVAYTERGQPVYVLDKKIPDGIKPKGRRRGIGTPDPVGPFANWLRDIYGQNVCVIVKEGRHSRIFKIGMGGDVFPVSARSIEVKDRKRLVSKGLLNKW